MREALSSFRSRLAVPGVGAATITAAGDLETVTVGYRRRDGQEQVRPDDQWHIGSCGKAITAVLYARLVELGYAEWGIPVRELFPDLAPDIDSGWSASTIDDLFHSRSGMRPNLPARAMIRGWRDERDPTDQRTAAVLLATTTAPRRRGAFRYSNLGYVVAGAAIDRLAGMPFEAALHTHVLAPLEIASVGYGPPPDICGHRARLRFPGLVVGPGDAMEPDNVRSDNPEVLSPAGRFYLTLADWAMFQRLFLCDGDPLLERSSIEHLLRPPSADGKGMAMGWAPTRLAGAAFGMQGSNTMWSATALMGAGRDRTAMVVANDGRSRVLARSVGLAAELLGLST
ncbi:MAG: serine hydrolase [Acidimicrobiia bacterium]|nr:serine hydrolase [Acidimicrobiia bacterium]